LTDRYPPEWEPPPQRRPSSKSTNAHEVGIPGLIARFLAGLLTGLVCIPIALSWYINFAWNSNARVAYLLIGMVPLIAGLILWAVRAKRRSSRAFITGLIAGACLWGLGLEICFTSLPPS
jgi:riboflavin transporter FmnP